MSGNQRRERLIYQVVGYCFCQTDKVDIAAEKILKAGTIEGRTAGKEDKKSQDCKKSAAGSHHGDWLSVLSVEVLVL